MRQRQVYGSTVFTFLLINVVSGDALGAVVYARRDWLPGDLIAPGKLRVVGVIDPIAGGLLPLLLVKPA
jgi:hypothetical protein